MDKIMKMSQVNGKANPLAMRYDIDVEVRIK